MRGKSKLLFGSLGLVFALLALYPVEAQDTGKAGIEGYVFNRKTLQPVPNVLVSLTPSLPGDRPQTALTDKNGFFQIETDAGSRDRRKLRAQCYQKGWPSPSVSEIELYDTLKEEVYRRDMYIDGCAPPDAGANDE